MKRASSTRSLLSFASEVNQPAGINALNEDPSPMKDEADSKEEQRLPVTDSSKLAAAATATAAATTAPVILPPFDPRTCGTVSGMRPAVQLQESITIHRWNGPYTYVWTSATGFRSPLYPWTHHYFEDLAYRHAMSWWAGADCNGQRMAFSTCGTPCNRRYDLPGPALRADITSVPGIHEINENYGIIKCETFIQLVWSADGKQLWIAITCTNETCIENARQGLLRVLKLHMSKKDSVYGPFNHTLYVSSTEKFSGICD